MDYDMPKGLTKTQTGLLVKQSQHFMDYVMDHEQRRRKRQVTSKIINIQVDQAVEEPKLVEPQGPEGGPTSTDEL